MKTVYEAVTIDKRYIPPKYTINYYGQTEKDVIEWLENNGGGVYRNSLHNFEMKVEGKKDNELKIEKIKDIIKTCEKWCEDQSNGMTDGEICLSAMKDIRRILKD